MKSHVVTWLSDSHRFVSPGHCGQNEPAYFQTAQGVQVMEPQLFYKEMSACAKIKGPIH